MDENSLSVTLTPEEYEWAKSIGLKRNSEAKKQGRSDAHGLTGTSGEKQHIEGACGELAFAKWLGVVWPATVNTYQQGGDVGNIQVRTRSRLEYDLLVRKNDKDGALFILMQGQSPTFRVAGGLWGKQCKNEIWSKGYGGRPPAYFVPRSALLQGEELLRAIIQTEVESDDKMGV